MSAQLTAAQLPQARPQLWTRTKHWWAGETLVGPNLPNLKYMLAAPSMEANAAGWKTFISHPDFVKMRDDPKYANTEPKITKLFLEPTAYSQV